MRVHHLNITCRNIDFARRIFTTSYSFTDCGWLFTNEEASKENKGVSKSYLLVKESIFIVLVQDDQVPVDTIDNIAFCVDSVPQHCADVHKYGGIVIEGPYFVDCIQRHFHKGDEASLPACACDSERCQNYIEQAVIKSSVGNINHTLLDKRNFKGYFLPGFVSTNCNVQFDNLINNVSHIDHIALAVPCGETSKHIKWYQNCLKMMRFKTNITENKSGLVIRGRNGNGLRMLTLSEHPCSYTAMSVDKNNGEVELRNDNVKFVFVESLKDEGSDQVQIYLKHHGGPGVQHVAFYTNDISEDAHYWMDCGVRFIKPPVAYYHEIESTLMKLKETSDVSKLSDVGILVDCEKHEGEDDEEDGYLYQVFTEPVFDSRTFFFELIQRDNATGFGAGNVSALWKALDSRFQTLTN